MHHGVLKKAELQTAPEGVSKYGGFLNKIVRATGFFRVEKIDNIWWIVDPEGYLFFSTGATGIGPRSEFARVQGREYIYKELPPADITVAGQASTTSHTRTNYSFYSWNLFRRFGADWYQKWMDMTALRMGKLGFEYYCQLVRCNPWSKREKGLCCNSPWLGELKPNNGYARCLCFRL